MGKRIHASNHWEGDDVGDYLHGWTGIVVVALALLGLVYLGNIWSSSTGALKLLLTLIIGALSVLFIRDVS